MRHFALLVVCALASAAATAPLGKQDHTKLRPVLVQLQDLPPLNFSDSNDQPVQNPNPTPLQNLESMYLLSLVIGLSYVVIVMIAAAVFQMTRRWPEPVQGMQGKDLRQWSSGPFDCCEDCQGFVLAFCCTGIRLAESFSMLGLAGFWTVVVMFTLVAAASQFLPFVGLALVIAGIIWRQTFRKRFDMPGQGECGNFVGDCLLYICCMPCAIAQEARHLDDAARADHEAVREQRPLRPQATQV